MDNQVGLYRLASFLSSAHVKINLPFFNKLLKDASKSNSPHRNQKFAKKIGCPVNETKKSAMTIYGWMKGYRTVPLSKLPNIISLSKYAWKDIEKNLIFIKAGIRSGEIKPRFPIKVDKKLGSVVGHILGDGSIEKRFHSLFYSNSDITLLKEFSSNMRILFGVPPRIWIQKRRTFEEKSEWWMRVKNLEEVPKKHTVGLFYPKICSDILYIICGKFAEGKNKRVTKEIKNSNKDFKIGFIRAFFDDECSINSKSYTLRLHQDRKIMLEKIRKILREFDINSNMVRSYNKREKLRSYFNINSFRNYSLFFEIIGCTSPKKKKEFKSLINKVKKDKHFKKKYPS